MAEKRMFSYPLIDGDDFMFLSREAQLLYFHIGMRADDDGFMDKWRSLLKTLEMDKEPLQELIETGFIYQFDSGVLLVRHWKINNTIKNDRYKPTKYLTEKNSTVLDEAKIYQMANETSKPSDSTMETVWNQNGTTDKISLDKVSLEKISIEQASIEQPGAEAAGDAYDFEEDWHPKSLQEIAREQAARDKLNYLNAAPKAKFPGSYPTRKQVREYAAENGFSESIADGFFNEMQVSGWTTHDGMPVKNWQNLALNTFTRKSNESKQVKGGSEALKNIITSLDRDMAM